MDLETRIPIGTSCTQTITVTEALTVGYTVPGMPMVFATPQMIHHMEVVCAAAIADLIAPGSVSVGIRVDVEHLAATPVGCRVTATGTVVAIAGAEVTFEVVAEDGTDVIGTGRHTRAVVEFERFIAGAKRKHGRSGE